MPQGYNDYGRLSLDFSWELDFWGKNRAAVAAATSKARAAQADAAQARLMLATSVAAAYADLARLYAERDVAERSVALRQETLNLVSDRVTNGLDTRGELRAASLTTTIWDRGANLHQNRIAESMASNDPAWLAAIEHLQAVGMSHAQAVGAVTAQVVNQAYLLSTIDFFRASAWLAVLLIPCIWFTNKAMSGGGAHAAAD